MKFWHTAHHFANSAILQLSVGLIIAFSGFWELIMIGLDEGSTLLMQPSNSIILLGVISCLVSFEHLVYGTKLTGLSIVGEKPRKHERRYATVTRRILEDPYFQIFLGALIFTAGLCEIILDSRLVPSSHGDDTVWPFGVVILGSMEIMKGMASALKSLMVIEKAEQDLGWHSRFIKWIEIKLRRPHFEIFVAVVLIVLGIWEEIVYEMKELDGVWFEAHIGMVIFAANTIARRLPMLFIGLQLVDDAGSVHKAKSALQSE